MIEAILPAAAAWAERFDDTGDSPLLAGEETLLGNVVDERRREFTTARMCARTALATLGLPPTPILHTQGGAPRWPPGVVGSITHCTGYRAASAGLASDRTTVGIDAEPDRPPPDGVLEVVARPEELGMVRDLTRLRPHGPSWDRLLFCAKETVYKSVVFPRRRMARQRAGDDRPRSGGETFVARLLERPLIAGRELTGFDGGWLARDGFLVTAIAVPAS